MSHNRSFSNNNDFDMIAISNVAAQLALDIRGPLPQRMIDIVVPRPRYHGIRKQPSNVDEELLRIWNDSQTKRDLDDFDSAVTTEASEGLKTVWKVFLRVFWKTPHEILSPNNQLRYRPTPSPGMEASHVVFTPMFSRLFAELAVHPCWEGNVNLLILAFQYTVKVRVDSRSPWPVTDALPDHVRNCSALGALSEMLFGDEPTATTNIQEMHIRAREAQREASPSEFSEFLVFLGQIARMYPSSDYSQTDLDLPTPPVTTKDLQILTEAAKRFHWDNIDWTESPEEVFKAYGRKGGLSDDQLPRNNQELKQLIRRSLVRSCHYIANWRVVFEYPNGTRETPSDNEVLPADESRFEVD